MILCSAVEGTGRRVEEVVENAAFYLRNGLTSPNFSLKRKGEKIKGQDAILYVHTEVQCKFSRPSALCRDWRKMSLAGP